MTDRKTTKRRKFAHEILGLIGISALVALVIFLILSDITTVIAEEYCFNHDVPMTEFDWIAVDRWILGSSAVISCMCFSLLFLTMLGDRLAYIRKLTKGIDQLRTGQANFPIPLEGNNELTELADAINYMSATQQQIREKEQTLAREKEQLIRTLSHDIRTPLTSILAYSEYLATESELSPPEQKAHLAMIRRKAEQIRDLTDILLDGGRRDPEHFDNARLLFEQLAAEFEAELEEDFIVNTDLSGCAAFAGAFDVQELRRIFDNLSSNVRKYADESQAVHLSIHLEDGALIIRQKNTVRTATEPQDSYKIGISSIRRIAQHYGGGASVQQEADIFAIFITLSDF